MGISRSYRYFPAHRRVTQIRYADDLIALVIKPSQHVGLQKLRASSPSRKRTQNARSPDVVENTWLWNHQTIIFLHTIASYQKWCSSSIFSEQDPISIRSPAASVPARLCWPFPVRRVRDRRSPCTLLHCSCQI